MVEPLTFYQRMSANEFLGETSGDCGRRWYMVDDGR